MLEVLPADGQDYAGLGVRDQMLVGYNFPSQLAVPNGAEVWIVVRHLGRVTLHARGL